MHWVENTVELDGTLRRVGLMPTEDAEGKLFSNLNADVEDWAQKSGSSKLPAKSRAGESEPLRQSANTLGKENLAALDDGVNLTSLSESARASGDVRAQKSGSSNLPSHSIPGESEPLHQSANTLGKETLAAPDDGVNLTFLSESADGRSGARSFADGATVVVPVALRQKGSQVHVSIS